MAISIHSYTHTEIDFGSCKKNKEKILSYSPNDYTSSCWFFFDFLFFVSFARFDALEHIVLCSFLLSNIEFKFDIKVTELLIILHAIMYEKYSSNSDSIQSLVTMALIEHPNCHGSQYSERELSWTLFEIFSEWRFTSCWSILCHSKYRIFVSLVSLLQKTFWKTKWRLEW